MTSRYVSSRGLRPGVTLPWPLWRKALEILGTVSAILPVMAVRALQPLVLIRFGVIQRDRIGHLANDPEHYLCRREAGTQAGAQIGGPYDIMMSLDEPQVDRQDRYA